MGIQVIKKTNCLIYYNYALSLLLSDAIGHITIQTSSRLNFLQIVTGRKFCGPMRLIYAFHYHLTFTLIIVHNLVDD